MNGTFAENLAHLRAKKGLTQRELGAAVGIAWSMISKYESGQSTPRLKILMRLADALGVTVENLQGYEPGSEVTSIILEEPDGTAMPMRIDQSALDQLKETARETGKPLGDVMSDMLRWGLKMLKEDPEFAASLKRQIEESRKADKNE